MLCECFRGGCTQRDDGVEIRNVPAFLQHIDVNNNLDSIVRFFKGEQLTDVLVFLLAALRGVDLNNLIAVVTMKEAG
ncbi:hypothetical protein SDC9_126725 [bioreactor metagenome]|uniref:Uncharacterized protein n=1 Tax=bioreactor metagenome TaxID=1076179 RepID=A0A645CRH9_9ZZZZ